MIRLQVVEMSRIQSLLLFNFERFTWHLSDTTTSPDFVKCIYDFSSFQYCFYQPHSTDIRRRGSSPSRLPAEPFCQDFTRRRYRRRGHMNKQQLLDGYILLVVGMCFRFSKLNFSYERHVFCSPIMEKIYFNNKVSPFSKNLWIIYNDIQTDMYV